MDALEKEPIAWQKREELGLVMALLMTTIQVLSSPGKFFDNLEIKKSYLEPLYFYFANCCVFSLVIILKPLLKKGISVQALLALIFALISIPIFALILVPIISFITTSIMHLSVLLFRGKGGFKGTFNVLSYAGATGILYFIPFIGPLVYGIWSSIVVVIAYKRIHKFSTAKAIFAYCLPVLFVIFLSLVAIAVAIAIPNLLRARSIANEAVATATVKMISTAIETYASTNNGQYPSDEYDLRYSTPPPFGKFYNNKAIQGYSYSLTLNPSGYEITATPSQCAVTGTKIFTIETKGKISEKNCK